MKQILTTFTALSLMACPILARGDCRELVKLIASDATAGDRFADSVAISGNTTVIGAFNEVNAAFSELYAVDIQ